MKALKLLFAACSLTLAGTVGRAGTGGGVMPETIGPVTVGEKVSVDFSLADSTASIFGASIMQHGAAVAACSTYSEAGRWTDYTCTSRTSANITLPFEFPCCGVKYTACNINSAGRLTLSSGTSGSVTISAAPMYYASSSSRYAQIGQITLSGDVVKYKSDSASATFLFKGSGKTGTTTTSVSFTITLHSDGRVVMAYSPLSGLYVGNGYPSVQAYGTSSSNTGFRQDPIELSSLGGDVVFRPLAAPQGYSITGSGNTRHFEWTPSAAGTYEFGVYINCTLANQVRYYTVTVNAGSGGGTEGDGEPAVSKYIPETSPVEQKEGDPTCLSVELADPTSTAYYYWYKAMGAAGSTLLSEGTSSSYDYAGGDAAQIKVEVWTSDKTKKIDENTWTLSAPVSDPEPEITVFSPTSTSFTMSTGDKTTFSVTAKSNDEGSPTYYWTDNNEAILDGSGRSVTSSSFEYEMTSARAAKSPHTIKCQVGNSYGKSVSQSWTVTYKAPTVVNPTIKSASPAGYGTSGNFLPAYVGEPVAFAVEVDNPGGTSFSYSWRAGGAVVATTSTYSWTPSNTGKTSVMCQLLVSGKSVASVTWMFDVTTKAPTITYSPTTLPAATESVAYAQTISFTGVTGILGANVVGLPTDCGATCRADTSDTSKLNFSWPSPVEGVYSLTIQMFYGEGACYEVAYALTVNAASGGEVTFSREAPTSENVAMAVGETQTFSVTASGATTGVSYSWGASDSEGGTASVVSKGLSCDFTPTKAGTYYVVFSYEKSDKSNEQVYWMVTVAGGGEGGDTKTPTVKEPTSESLELEAGAKATLAVEVENASDDVGYKWYRYASGTGTWSQLGTCTTATYSYMHPGTMTATSPAVQYKVEVYSISNSTTVYGTKFFAITTKASATTPTLTRADPSDASCTMTVGDSKEFSVSASGLDTLVWYVGSASTGSTGTKYTYTATKAGTYSVICKGYVSGTQQAGISWTVKVNEKSSGGDTSSAIEIVPALSAGKVGTPYTTSNFSVKDMTLGRDYTWGAPYFVTSRSRNTFAASAGNKVTVTGTYIEQTAAFAFPYCGSTLPTVRVFGDVTRLVLYRESGTGGETASMQINPFQGAFSTKGSGDGIFYSTDGSTYMTFRWKGALSTTGGDRSGGSADEQPINVSVTLKANGGMVIAYGDCDGMAIPEGMMVQGSGPSGSGVYYYSSSETEYISTSTQDIVLDYALPPGLAFNANTGVLSGTPTEAGTYNFTVTANLISSGTQLSTNCMIVVEAASGGGEGGGGSEGGEGAYVRDTPSEQNQSMSVGGTMAFSVKSSGSGTGAGGSWGVSSEADPTATVTSDGLSCTFTPTKAGTYYVIFSYGESGQEYWIVTVSGGSEGGGEGGGGSEGGDPEPEKDAGILPIATDDIYEVMVTLQHRMSVNLGVFTNQIVRKNGQAAEGLSVSVLGESPAGVVVTEGGLVSGVMTEDLDGEQMTLELSVPLGGLQRVSTNVITFAKRATANTEPYLAGSMPEASSFTAYQGVNSQGANTVRVFAFDGEANTVTYKWFFDGVEQSATGSSYMPLSSKLGLEGSVHTVACYASDGTNVDIPLKTWTLTTSPTTFAILGAMLPPDVTVDGSFGLISYRLPENEYVVRLDVVRGELPPGIITLGGTPPSSGGVDARFGGCFRKMGTYSFTLRGLCSNGETAECDFTVTVGGTDSAPKTWNVGSSGSGGTGGTTKGTTGGTTGKGDSGGATTVNTITSALSQGAAAGDTIHVYSSAYSANEDLSTFRYLKDIVVTSHCHISLSIGAHVPDLTAFDFDEGYEFKLEFDTEKYILEDDSYGALAPIAKMNEDTPCQLGWSLASPYFIGTPALDADGYLSVAIGLTSINESTDLLHLPDNEAQRTVVFENAAFAKDVKIVSDGVLPATITFKGENTLTGKFGAFAEGYLDETKMIVKSDATMIFAGGALYDSKLGGLVLEPGATLKFDPSEGKMLFNGYRLYMPKAGQAKVRFVLTGTRASGAGACALSARYMGDDDPMNVIEIVPQSGDTTTYRVYRGAEQMLFFEAVQTPDAGDIVWTEEDNPPTANGTLGTPFSCQFKAHGGSYRTFAYSLTDGAYTWSRAEENTFDDTVGTRELMQAAYRVGASEVSAPVEIGFPFPCGSNFIATVDIGANRLLFGDYVLFLQDKGFLSTLTTLSHVYIDRQADSFTVRWGEFASATLTPDGKIRVAFGPAADTRAAVDPQVPLYWINDGSVYGIDLSSAEPYAGSNDIIVTPSCPPGLRLEGDTLTGVPLVPGAYSVNVKVVADGQYEMSRTFTVAIGSGRFREDAPAINVTKAPEVGADGYVHLALGEGAEFAASVADGQQMRWTLDGAPLAVSGGSYVLTAPATRTLDAAGAKIHCLAIEADDGTGRWNFSVRKSWQIVYNRSVYIDAAKATSGGGTSTGGGTSSGGRTGGGTTAGGGSTADGLTPETAFGEFPDDLFKYLLNGDEVIVAPGTYAKPIDFLANTAAVVIRAADPNARPVIDLTGNTKGYTRCFRQGYYSVEVGYSGSYEQIYQPLAAALVQDFVLKGGAIEEDIHDEYAMQLYPESSVNYYGVVGGGVFGGSFQGCLISGCLAKDYGGGAYGASLTRCVVENCSAGVGGGCANCNLMNCTVVGNVATTKAGGIDGQCTARSSIIYGNEAAGKSNDYANTTTPVHLVPYVPSLANCFTTADGDPAFCADYHLSSGSPAIGKGAYPDADATECLVFVEVVGGGTVTPNDPDGTKVEIGGSLVLTAGGSRAVEAIYTNGVQAVGASSPFELANVAANTTVTFVFANAALAVGADKEFKTICSAIAAAQPGDTIKIDAGAYVERLDVSGFGGKLVIEAADANNPPVVDAAGAGRCVMAKRNSDDVVFRNLIFENGYAAYTSPAANPVWDSQVATATDADLLAYGFGGGVFGGRFENCTIRNCTAQGGMGGGAFCAKLIGCTVTDNTAGYKTNDDRLRQVFGGGVFGGYADTCNVSSNSVKGCKTQVYCSYDGAGTYDAEVRNSFVWDNYIDCGSGSSRIGNETANGNNGVVIHSEEKAPTEARLEAHTDPIPQEGTTQTYASKAEAETAAAKQVVEISTEVAKAISDQKAYEDMFEIKSVETSEGSGEYVNKPVIKEEVAEVVEAQIDTALSADADGNPQSAEELAAELTPENQSMTKTVKTTTPGLYYALEFSSDMSTGSFVGERHLSTGGSMKLSATSLQTPSGFWRLNVYTTPDGK